MSEWLKFLIIILVVDIVVTVLERLTGQPRVFWLFMLLILVIAIRHWWIRTFSD